MHCISCSSASELRSCLRRVAAFSYVTMEISEVVSNDSAKWKPERGTACSGLTGYELR